MAVSSCISFHVSKAWFREPMSKVKVDVINRPQSHQQENHRCRKICFYRMANFAYAFAEDENQKMYQPGLLLKAYNQFVQEAKRLGVAAQDIALSIRTFL